MVGRWVVCFVICLSIFLLLVSKSKTGTFKKKCHVYSEAQFQSAEILHTVFRSVDIY